MDIGFIGLGNMGYPMARRLVEAGHKLVVYDTSGQMMSRLTAIGAVAAPPLAYGPYLLEEPLAYPYSTTALWATAVAVARPSRGRIALAAALALVAPFVRGELAVLLAVFAAGMAVLLWRTERFTRWRSSWTTWDWVGAVVLTIGAALAVSAAYCFLSVFHLSSSTSAATRASTAGSRAGAAGAASATTTGTPRKLRRSSARSHTKTPPDSTW